MEENTSKTGLKSWDPAVMIATALFYDGLQFLLNFIFMGWLVSIFAFMHFYFWFKIRGMTFMKPKRAIAMWGGFIFELIPILSSLPAWTATVTVLILDAKAKKIIAKVPGGAAVVNTSNVLQFKQKQGAAGTSSTSNLKKAA